jgi:hypothetical protein
MKTYKIFSVFLIAVLGSFAVSSCRDESLNPVPEPDAGVNGLGRFVLADGSFMPSTKVPGPSDLQGFGTSLATVYSKVFFSSNNLANSKVKVNLRWLSYDRKVQITKMKVYVLFLEDYVDSQGNDATVDHGNEEGRSSTALEFPGKNHNEPVEFEITADQVYDLYKDATFDYDKKDASGKSIVISVFNNPDNPRPAGKRFVPGDTFQIRWEFTTADGTVYKRWSSNIAGATAFANTFLQWIVK